MGFFTENLGDDGVGHSFLRHQGEGRDRRAIPGPLLDQALKNSFSHAPLVIAKIIVPL